MADGPSGRGWGLRPVDRGHALLVAAAAALGVGVADAAIGLSPEADPARWTLGEGSVPIEVAALAGDLRPRADALDLWSYRVASPKLAPFADGTVELDARVPEGGQLSVRFGADTVAGPMRPVLPPLDGPPVAGRPGAPGGAGVPEGPPPAGSPGAGAPGGGAPGSGATGAPPAGANGAPGAPPPAGGPGGPGKPPERGVGLLVDRGARGSILGRGLDCTPARAPAGPEFRLGLVARGGSLEVTIDGAPVARCTGTWSPGALVLGSGVRRVQVARISVAPAGAAPFTDGFGSPVGGLVARVMGAGLFGALAALAGRRLDAATRRALAVAALPLLALPLLGRLRLRGALDALRMLEVPEALGPLVFAGVPAAVALAVAAGARAPRPARAAALGLGPLALLALLLAPRLGALPADAPGWAVLSGLAVPLALLGWVNAHPFSRRVAASWALSALVLGCAELGLRRTALDATWTATAGWKRASEEFAELLEIRRYRAYPDEGFPVRPPAPDPARRRIVALGGSSTGGAYQMDDIEQFWPRRLQDRLSGWQVVNQGVGGWNTLHVRLYLESQVERLDADIYALYIGHNDILSPAPVPYRQMYASWRAPSGAVRAVSGALNQVRLYVGLKYALFALASQRDAVAVPIADARENLAAIVATAQAHGARVLLVNEGLNPDPLPMATYGAMLEALAAETGSGYLDAARAFAKEDPDLFLDDCHLSVEGHTVLAGWIEGRLRELGWL